MRVLVTRPSDQAARTARRLAALGHEPVLAPALEIAPTGAIPPEGAFGLVLATSAQAFAGWAAAPALRAIPLACVGEKTAQAGHEAGFSLALVAPRAEDLAERLIAARPPQKALYLAGRERKPVLENLLRAAGWLVTLVETYDARPVGAWPAEVDAALERGEIEAVLHYSLRSAEAALTLMGSVAKRLKHYCLSDEIASLCAAMVPPERIFKASQPDEESLMTLIGPSGRPAGSASV